MKHKMCVLNGLTIRCGNFVVGLLHLNDNWSGRNCVME